MSNKEPSPLPVNVALSFGAAIASFYMAIRALEADEHGQLMFVAAMSITLFYLFDTLATVVSEFRNR